MIQVFNQTAVIVHLYTTEAVCLLVTFMGPVQVKLTNPTFGHKRPKTNRHPVQNTPKVPTL